MAVALFKIRVDGKRFDFLWGNWRDSTESETNEEARLAPSPTGVSPYSIHPALIVVNGHYLRWAYGLGLHSIS